MRVRLVVVRASLLATLIGCIAAIASPSRALACSAAADFNPADAADVLVAARATDVVPLGVAPGTGFVSMRVTFEVDTYLKGTGGSTLLADDIRAAHLGPGLTPTTAGVGAPVTGRTIDELRLQWGGDGCSALTEDPRGRYFVLGLTREADGTLRMNRLLLFAVGDGPSDARIAAGMQRAETLLDARLTPPRTGHGSAESRSPADPPLLLLLATAAVVTGARVATGLRLH